MTHAFDLWRNVFTFGTDREIYGTQVRLLPDGRIGGYENPNERWWSDDGDGLAFHDSRGRCTTRFGAADTHGVRIGRFGSDGPVHRLAPTVPIHRHAMISERDEAEKRTADCPRRNLVILRAGPGSRHPNWLDDVPEGERSWDLCVSTYGGAHFEGWAAGDYAVVQDGRGKFRALWSLLHAASPFWTYDYIMLCDDDLDARRSDIEAVFWRMREHDLLIGQPALAPESHILHQLTQSRPDQSIRFTNFVELMVPVFRSWVLYLVTPAFANAVVGYGLDHLWRFLVGNPRGRIGILDDVTFVHTRPPGTTYDVAATLAEQSHLQYLYRFSPRCEEIGSIRR